MQPTPEQLRVIRLAVAVVAIVGLAGTAQARKLGCEPDLGCPASRYGGECADNLDALKRAVWARIHPTGAEIGMTAEEVMTKPRGARRARSTGPSPRRENASNGSIPTARATCISRTVGCLRSRREGRRERDRTAQRQAVYTMVSLSVRCTIMRQLQRG
jgi:hypothetical protein